MIFIKAENRASFEGCPDSYMVNGIATNLKLYETIVPQPIKYYSGTAMKEHEVFISPRTMRIPAFEELKDDQFKEPYNNTSITEKIFNGWAINGNKNRVITSLPVNILMAEYMSFTADYTYKVKIQAGIRGAGTELIISNFELVGDKIQPLDSNWFKTEILERFDLDWEQVDFIQMTSGGLSFEVHEGDIINLDDFSTIKIEVQTKVEPVQAYFQLYNGDPKIIELNANKIYTFAELSEKLQNGNIFKIVDDVTKEEYFDKFRQKKEYEEHRYEVLTDTCEYVYRFILHTLDGQQIEFQLTTTPTMQWTWDGLETWIPDYKIGRLKFSNGTEIKRDEEEVFYLGYELDTAPAKNYLRIIDAYEAEAAKYIVTMKTPDWAGMGLDIVELEIVEGNYSITTLVDKVLESYGGDEGAFNYLGTPKFILIQGDPAEINVPIAINEDTLVEVIGSDTELNFGFEGDGETYWTYGTLPLTIDWDTLDREVYPDSDYRMKLTKAILPDGTEVSDGPIVITNPGYVFDLDIMGQYEGSPALPIKVQSPTTEYFDFKYPYEEGSAITTTLTDLTTVIRNEATKRSKSYANRLIARCFWDASYDACVDYMTGQVFINPDQDEFRIIATEGNSYPISIDFYGFGPDGTEVEYNVITFDTHEVPKQQFIDIITQLVNEYGPGMDNIKINNLDIEIFGVYTNWPITNDIVQLPYFVDDVSWMSWINYELDTERNCSFTLVRSGRETYKGTQVLPKQTTTDEICRAVYKYLGGSQSISWCKVDGDSSSFNESDHYAITLPNKDPVPITYNYE